MQSNALISISTQPQDCIRWCQTHWHRVLELTKTEAIQNYRKVSELLWKLQLCQRKLYSVSAAFGAFLLWPFNVCGFHHSKNEKKKDCIIWTVNSIWDVDTVLNKLLCTVEPIAIAIDFWLWARSSEQSQSNDKCWENASPDSDRSSCADSKKAASWLHQQCLTISSSNHCFCLAFCFYCPLSCIGSQGIPGCLWGISLFSPSCAATPWTDPALQAQLWQFCELSCFQQNLKLVSSIFNLVHTVPFSPMNLQD